MICTRELTDYAGPPNYQNIANANKQNYPIMNEWELRSRQPHINKSVDFNHFQKMKLTVSPSLQDLSGDQNLGVEMM